MARCNGRSDDDHTDTITSLIRVQRKKLLCTSCVSPSFRLNLYPKGYSLLLKILVKTPQFDTWLKNLKDKRAKAKILFRLQRVERNGHLGDCKPIGHGISEIRIHYAKGYRIYFREKDDVVILLLLGGDKSTQKKDVKKVKEIWLTLKKNEDENNKV